MAKKLTPGQAANKSDGKSFPLGEQEDVVFRHLLATALQSFAAGVWFGTGVVVYSQGLASVSQHIAGLATIGVGLFMTGSWVQGNAG